MAKENQQSRYGAMAKQLQFTTGATYFLVSISEYAAAKFLNTYPQDSEGAPRVFTTWAAVISQIQANTDADHIVVSPLFVTAPTKAQQLQLDAASVVVTQAGSNLPDGSYIAATSGFSEAATTTNNVFAITGRVLVTQLLGEIVTTLGAATQNSKFTMVPTVGSTTDLCATGTTTAQAAGSQILITGVLSAALIATTQSAVAEQATKLILTAGTLQLITSATTTGNAKVRIHYKPLDPGAFISPLQ